MGAHARKLHCSLSGQVAGLLYAGRTGSGQDRKRPAALSQPTVSGARGGALAGVVGVPKWWCARALACHGRLLPKVATHRRASSTDK
eukprot:353794-Chlamydomonas_euryale.AAC.7